MNIFAVESRTAQQALRAPPSSPSPGRVSEPQLGALYSAAQVNMCFTVEFLHSPLIAVAQGKGVKVLAGGQGPAVRYKGVSLRSMRS